jgi:saccharopine dehydrogenase-like NADP-dependent oxidoreductase
VLVLAVVLLFQLKDHNIGGEPADVLEHLIRDSENCESNVNGLFCELFPARGQNGGQMQKYFYNSVEKLPDGVC